MEELISLKATNGIITLFEDRAVISRNTAMGFLTQGIRGDRTFYYKDLSAIDYKKPTMLANGYIQFIVAGTPHVNASVGLFASSQESLKDPNTVILRAFNKETPIIAEKLYGILMQKISEYRDKGNTTVVQNASPADEIRKFKQLFDDGLITQDEYDKKKKELLGT